MRFIILPVLASLFFCYGVFPLTGKDFNTTISLGLALYFAIVSVVHAIRHDK
jgi:hypothetical protein